MASHGYLKSWLSKLEPYIKIEAFFTYHRGSGRNYRRKLTVKKSISLHWFGEKWGGGWLPGGANGKEHTCQCRRGKRRRFNTWAGKIPWRSAQQLALVFLPGESHGQRSLAGYSLLHCRVEHDWSDLSRMVEKRSQLPLVTFGTCNFIN